MDILKPIKICINFFKVIKSRYEEYPIIFQKNQENKILIKLKEEDIILLNEKISKLQLEMSDNLEILKKSQELNLLLQSEIAKHNLPRDTFELITYYKNKYLQKGITYAGLPIQLKDKVLKPKISVPDYVHITESMRRFVNDNNLMYNGDYSIVDLSKHMLKVYTKFLEHKKYIYDSDLYGPSEVWQSNFLQTYIVDTYGRMLMDCENCVNYCLGLIEASGVPVGLAKATAGVLNCGFGHATLTAYDWRTGGFEIWETTADYPMVIKKGSKYDFKTIWFSYDGHNTYSTLARDHYTNIKTDSNVYEMMKKDHPEAFEVKDGRKKRK